MSTINLNEHSKSHAFDTIMANAKNEKLTDAEFRAFIVDTWGSDPVEKEHRGKYSDR